MKRRTFVKSGLAAASISLAGARCGDADSVVLEGNDITATPSMRNTNSAINHSVCKWCYPSLTVDELAVQGKAFGLQSIELLEPEDWPTLAKHDLVCAMANAPSIGDKHFIVHGFNRVENHDDLVAAYEERIRAVANAGYPNLICFSGNRNGLDDEQGLKNCAVGLKRIMATAEQHKVTICMELLNSRVDHGDYQCDRTAWGVELVKAVGSDRFKLLYDIYHMQIMEGDVIRTLTTNSEFIGHYHTGGNPGRNEIDETQELNYAAIMNGIVATGYDGFVGQEFIPKRDPITSLREAIELCSV